MSRLTFLSNDPRGQSSRRRQSVGTPSALSPLPPRARCPPPCATIAPRRPKSSAAGRARPRGGAPKRISFDNPALFEESRTRPAPECRAGGGPRRTPAPREGGRRPRRRDLSGYSDARGGERDGSAEGDALTSPSRSSRARRRSPPVCTPTSRRRPPQRGHSKTSRANTRRSSAAHIEALSRGDPTAPGDGAARCPAAVGPSSTPSGPPQ